MNYYKTLKQHSDCSLSVCHNSKGRHFSGDGLVFGLRKLVEILNEWCVHHQQHGQVIVAMRYIIQPACSKVSLLQLSILTVLQLTALIYILIKWWSGTMIIQTVWIAIVQLSEHSFSNNVAGNVFVCVRLCDCFQGLVFPIEHREGAHPFLSLSHTHARACTPVAITIETGSWATV